MDSSQFRSSKIWTRKYFLARHWPWCGVPELLFFLNVNLAGSHCNWHDDLVWSRINHLSVEGLKISKKYLNLFLSQMAEIYAHWSGQLLSR